MPPPAKRSTKSELWPAIESSAVSSANMVKTIPPGSITSLGELTDFAPLAINGSAFCAVRLYTRNRYPAFRRLAAMGKPILPKPIKPRDISFFDGLVIAFLFNITGAALCFLCYLLLVLRQWPIHPCKLFEGGNDEVSLC